MSRDAFPPASDQPARLLVVSSRADLRLRAAGDWLRAIPRDADALLIAADPHAADEFVRADVAASGTRFGLQRFTVGRLAARLAAPELAARGQAPSTSLTLAALVTRAVHRLVDEGGAGRFSEIARRPGFPHAVVRTLEELRAAGGSSADLRARGPAGHDLAAIVDAVEREREALGLADRAMVLEVARGVVERAGGTNGGSPGGAAGAVAAASIAAPIGAPVLLLDVSPASRLEHELIAAVVSRAPRVCATVPAGDADAARRLEAILGVAATLIEAPDGDSLSRLQRHLFETTAPERHTLDDSVTLASWPGEARECVEIARRIRAEAAAGVPFDRMAVLLRAPGAYRAHLQEALRRASIPAYFARGSTRPDPAGRAFLALLACAADGLAARRFAEYLSLAQVPEPGDAHDRDWSPPSHDLLPTATLDAIARPADEPPPATPDPDAPVVAGTLRAPWRWERLLVDAAVIGGRERWRRRLDGLAEELALQRRDLPEEDARAAGLARVATDLENLRDFALPLIDRLAAFPERAPWGEWLERLRALASAALRQPTGVLAVLAEMEPLAPVGPVDLSAVQHVLSPRLRDLTVAPESRRDGCVFVAPVELARGAAFDVVFVPGLAEKVFPQRIVDDPLLPDETRRALGADGLPTLASRVTAERLALRLAAGAACRRVVLSWPRIDVEQARPRVPSFYALEALRATEGRLPGFDELRRRAETGGVARLGWPAPERPEDAIDDAEYDLAILTRVIDADAETSAGAAHYLLAANPHLTRALRARGRRWLRRWTISDGLVDPDDDARAALARHQMGVRSFSPTALENFSACPYRFLLQAIHRLQPREESEPLETIDPLTKGSLFHEVQFQVLTALRDDGRLPLDPDHLEHAIKVLDETVDRVAAAYEDRLAPAIPRVWNDGIQAIRADLREWLRRSTESAHGWVPHRFEMSFGLTGDRRRSVADASSVSEPVAILDGALLRGSIDLVERRADGMIRVTDHKTGKVRAKEGAVIGGGQTLQPVIYALVAEAALGGPVESGRLYYCTADGDFTERVIPLDELSRELAGKAVNTVASALERGFLPAAPVKDACVWCDYRPVCGPYEETRTGRKPDDRIEDLLVLRALP